MMVYSRHKDRYDDPTYRLAIGTPFLGCYIMHEEATLLSKSLELFDEDGI